MTTTISSSVAALDRKLNQMILAGQAMEAFEEFYADDCEMQENSAPPTVGKEANRRREEEFFNSIETFHGAELLASAAEGDVSLSEWTMDITFKGGQRTQLAQAVVRRWKDGKIVKERFYYSQG